MNKRQDKIKGPRGQGVKKSSKDLRTTARGPSSLRSRRQMKDRLFVVFAAGAAALCVIALLTLLTTIGVQGYEFLDMDFLKTPPSRKPDKAGIYPALIGTVYICVCCAAAAIPLGVGTAVLLEEFKPRNVWLRKLHGFVQLNITNLAGVPSVVYGILGLTVFVSAFGVMGNPNDPAWTMGTPENWYYLQLPFGRSVIAGGLTLMLVVLPIVIIASQEALRAVPDSLRQGAFGLGATRWQMVSRTTLPAALPGIMTGSILAMSRAIGEAAPILIISGVVYIRFTPEHLMDDFTAMPLQIYDWAGRPQEAFHHVAASGIIVLLAVLLSFNAIAIFIRHRCQKTKP